MLTIREQEVLAVTRGIALALERNRPMTKVFNAALAIEVSLCHGEALRFDARNLKGIRAFVRKMSSEATTVLGAIKATFSKLVALFA